MQNCVLTYVHTYIHVQDCDDGNVYSGDGCSASCRIERGFSCDTTAANSPELRCTPNLGDGIRVVVSAAGRASNKSEECDDGNKIGM
jgi:cysteine-rich repeat protein